MSKILAATTMGLALTFTLPTLAADTAGCQASWSKMDAKKTGYVMHADQIDHMAMMTKAGRKTATADRMTDKEYMDACMADVFEAGKR
jgi:hypothetical protein